MRSTPRPAWHQGLARAGSPRPRPRWMPLTALTPTSKRGLSGEAAASPPAGGLHPAPGLLPPPRSRARDRPRCPPASPRPPASRPGGGPRSLEERTPRTSGRLCRGPPPLPSLTGRWSPQKAAPEWRTLSESPGESHRTARSRRTRHGTPSRSGGWTHTRTRDPAPGGCRHAAWVVRELQRAECRGEAHSPHTLSPPQHRDNRQPTPHGP